MNILRRLITILSGSGQPKSGAGDRSPVETGRGTSRYDAMWDEALMSSLHCETARSFLDHMGPRWK